MRKQNVQSESEQREEANLSNLVNSYQTQSNILEFSAKNLTQKRKNVVQYNPKMNNHAITKNFSQSLQSNMVSALNATKKQLGYEEDTFLNKVNVVKNKTAQDDEHIKDNFPVLFNRPKFAQPFKDPSGKEVFDDSFAVLVAFIFACDSINYTEPSMKPNEAIEKMIALGILMRDNLNGVLLARGKTWTHATLTNMVGSSNRSE